MALTQALDRGMGTPQQLRKDASERGMRVAELVDDALRKVRR